MAANDYSMGKYMQSQQNPCKLDGLGKSKGKVSQCYTDRWSEQDDELQKMIYGRVSAVEVHKSAGNGLLREE